MKNTRRKFWLESTKLINWCTDTELEVLKNRINKELASRLTGQESKYFPNKDKDNGSSNFKSSK